MNPSFPVSLADAGKSLEAIRATAKPLSRPLVVVGGFRDFGVPVRGLASKFKRLFRDDRIITVSFSGCRTWESCRERLIAEVELHFPSSTSNSTGPVDVVAISMGGLVSRYSSMANPGKTLLINRLFTIATPHQGSRLARLPTFNPLQRDMRPNSNFLEQLSAFAGDYPIFPYVRLRDEYVSLKAAAPVGQDPLWVPSSGFNRHNTSYRDARFIADISLRLRGETPLTIYPQSQH